MILQPSNYSFNLIKNEQESYLELKTDTLDVWIPTLSHWSFKLDRWRTYLQHKPNFLQNACIEFWFAWIEPYTIPSLISTKKKISPILLCWFPVKENVKFLIAHCLQSAKSATQSHLKNSVISPKYDLKVVYD